MKHLNGRSILYRYLLSFISIAMLSCAMVGMVTYVQAARELRLAAQEDREKRLAMAAQDIEAQFELLQEIAYRIRTTVYYQPAYVGCNPYYEIELLNDLVKYKGYSSLYTHYFIRYAQSEMIFTDMGKSYLASFSGRYIGAEDTIALAAFLDECKVPSVFSLNGGVLAVFPVVMRDAFDYNGNAVVCFYVTNEALLERMRLMSGEQIQSLQVLWDGQSVAEMGEISVPLQLEQGHFAFVFDAEELDTRLDSRFLHTNWLLIILSAVLLCALAVYAAVRSWRPIDKLASRYDRQGRQGNELEHLDRTLSEIEGQLQLSREQLDARVQQLETLHRTLLRSFILQLVRGEANEAEMQRLQSAGVRFPGNSFRVFVLHCDGAKSADSEQSIQDLSDDGTAFYTVPFGGVDYYVVLVNGEQDEAAEDLLREACPEAQFYGGKKAETISEIPALVFEALTEAAPSCVTPADIADSRDDRQLRRLDAALERGDREEALTALREYCAAYENDDPTVRGLKQNSLLSVLLGASLKANVNVPRAFLQGSAEAWSLLDGWVSVLCDGRQETAVQEEHQVIRYLRDHALDNDLSLESLAAAFGRSSRQIARIIQSETGSSYKELLLRLRMEHAKELLLAGQSVADTGKAVCYASPSHFIKAFAAYAGMTPSRYREQETMKCADEARTL